MPNRAALASLGRGAGHTQGKRTASNTYPTNAEYGAAVETALEHAGISPEDAQRMAAGARANRIAFGYLELTAELHGYWMARYRDWNRLVGEIKAVLLPVIYPACELLGERQGLGLKLRNAAAWDLVAACMEYEYADLVAPKFYDRLGKFYLAGRLPCGWQGEYPQGKLEIY